MQCEYRERGEVNRSMYRLFFVGARVYWSSSVPNIVFWPLMRMKMLKTDDAMMM